MRPLAQKYIVRFRKHVVFANLGRVLILSWSPTQINIYAPDGTRRHTVPLPADLDEPQNVLETGTGTYIITQGWTNSAVCMSHSVEVLQLLNVCFRQY